ncbi:protein draper-like [Drosophila persimilis]|uniref:protein draper-like n=1 Tax=Drosophila persimilis TaxID=7234 RepID=UPI000F07B3AE|nr:protein draper-like isoform X2 [Drosophila persimilis]XP_026848137.1 protein draper-like [Drosophila persimilis]
MLRIILFGWLLAGPALLVHSELTELDGPNICKRRESYPVEVVYTELQSYQERGSNWCLTIPPRCSTYRIKNRVVNKTKTIMKNRIVRDCCDGYVSSGGECVPHCTDHCEHGRCIAPEKCKCDHGYGGPACDISSFNLCFPSLPFPSLPRLTLSYLCTMKRLGGGVHVGPPLGPIA